MDMDRKLKASELKLEARRLLAGKYGTSAGMLVVVFLLSILGSIAIFFPLIPAIFGAGVTGRVNEGWIFGGLAAFFGCALPAPHGGIFVFPVIRNIPGYLVALAAGSLAGMLILALLREKTVLPPCQSAMK